MEGVSIIKKCKILKKYIKLNKKSMERTRLYKKVK